MYGAPITASAYFLGIAASLTGATGGGEVWATARDRSYITTHAQSTFSTIENAIHLVPQQPTTDFSTEVTSIYTNLLASQEPLGAEFEAIWDANIGQLYET